MCCLVGLLFTATLSPPAHAQPALPSLDSLKKKKRRSKRPSLPTLPSISRKKPKPEVKVKEPPKEIALELGKEIKVAPVRLQPADRYTVTGPGVLILYIEREGRWPRTVKLTIKRDGKTHRTLRIKKDQTRESLDVPEGRFYYQLSAKPSRSLSGTLRLSLQEKANDPEPPGEPVSVAVNPEPKLPAPVSPPAATPPAAPNLVVAEESAATVEAPEPDAQESPQGKTDVESPTPKLAPKPAAPQRASAPAPSAPSKPAGPVVVHGAVSSGFQTYLRSLVRVGVINGANVKAEIHADKSIDLIGSEVAVDNAVLPPYITRRKSADGPIATFQGRLVPGPHTVTVSVQFREQSASRSTQQSILQLSGARRIFVDADRSYQVIVTLRETPAGPLHKFKERVSITIDVIRSSGAHPARIRKGFSG